MKQSTVVLALMSISAILLVLAFSVARSPPPVTPFPTRAGYLYSLTTLSGNATHVAVYNNSTRSVYVLEVMVCSWGNSSVFFLEKIKAPPTGTPLLGVELSTLERRSPQDVLVYSSPRAEPVDLLATIVSPQGCGYIYQAYPDSMPMTLPPGTGIIVREYNAGETGLVTIKVTIAP